MEQIIIDVGNSIRRIRKSKNLTQQQLADIIGCELSTINRVELGKTNVRVGTIIAIATGLEISLYELFKGTKMEYFFDDDAFKIVYK